MKLKIIVRFSLLVISILLLSWYTTFSTSLQSYPYNEASGVITEIPEPYNPDAKYILYWTPMVYRCDWYVGLGSKIFEGCKYTCLTTCNRRLLPVEKFDAILFHGYEYNERQFGKPEKRDPKQIYVFGNVESPSRTPNYTDAHCNFYNWTMTYRQDSDVVRPYGYIEERNDTYELPSVEQIQGRPKKIIWFVSNCKTPSKRELLYEQILKYIPIDAFGNCHQLKCSREEESKCYDMMEDKYKFYLAFENSVCDEYVTEKLYNVLQKNIVPIVYGGANYSALLPPKSVINVMDFKSVSELVDYIRFLDENPEEYLKYFDWKKTKVSVRDNRFLCDLCAKLSEPIAPKTYTNISAWWRGENSEKCSDAFIMNFL